MKHSLPTLRLSHRLAVMLMLPILGLLWFAQSEMRTLSSLRTQSRTAVDLAVLSADLSAVLHELQQERGLSAGYLSGAGDWFDTALPAQKLKTDRALAELDIRVNATAESFDATLRNRMAAAFLNRDKLAKQRASVLAREIKGQEALEYYSSWSTALLDIIDLLGELRLSTTFNKDVASFVNFLHAKEFGGIERAILVTIFADDSFDPGAYEHLRTVIAAQTIYFSMFQKHAHEKFRGIHRNLVLDPSFKKTARMRRVALNNAAIGNFRINPETWYAMQTQKLNQLRKVEVILTTDLKLNAIATFDRASSRLAVGAVVILTLIGIVILLAVLMTRRILQQLGADPAELFRIAEAIAGKKIGGDPVVTGPSTGAGRDQCEKISLASVLQNTQAELRQSIQSLQRLATAVESAAEGVVILDANACIEYVNPAFLRYTQYTAEEIIGRRPGEIAKQDSDSEEIARLRAAMTAGQPWSGILHIERRDGRMHDEEHTVSPIRDAESGHVTNYVSIVRDVTDRIQMERQLRQAQKLESIGQLAAGIAHEINTPTQYVSDNTVFLQRAFAGLIDAVAAGNVLLETARTGHVDDDAITTAEAAFKKAKLDFLQKQVPPAFEQSLEGLEQVSRIVSAMKEFSHPAQDKTRLDLNRAIQSTITVARNEWKYVAEMHTEFDESLPLVPCLPGEFNQVILNIIVNAAHAISDVVGDGGDGRGQITVTTRQIDDFAEVRIGDTGAGMPEDVRARIFDAFFTTKAVGKGTGQGLAIAYNVIVEKHGGTIDVESAPGQGTTFILRLPLNATTDGSGSDTDADAGERAA